ncbi:glycosyl transferase family 90-domain-containing protein [Mycena crocata]|nr:glycosyl transferase family 90-domain-containing protein [Mycena crocata]
MSLVRTRRLLTVLSITAVCFVAGYVRVVHFPVNDGPPVLQKHIFADNGLLEVDPLGIHPIFTLIQRAEVAWSDKLDRASTSFPQAVAEYRRRYKRDPPKGFHAWWDYVREHDVQLPDEYDQIYKDLEPFWGVSPKLLLARVAEIEGEPDSYTIAKTANSKISLVNVTLKPGHFPDLKIGSKIPVMTLLNDVVHEHLPAFRAVYSPDDPPNRLSDYFVESAARLAAAENRHIDQKDLPKASPMGWTAACAPGSPGRNASLNLDGEPPLKTTKKTFIHDHKLSMDPCLHPRHFWQHGLFIWNGTGPPPRRDMVPQFAYSVSPIHHNIRVPTQYLWVKEILPKSDDPEWDDKVDERLLWRGSSTGISWAGDGAHVSMRLKKSHRIALVKSANDLNGTISILPPVKSNMDPVGEPITVQKSRLNPALMDVAFSGWPIMCGRELCEHLRKTYTWRDRQGPKEAGQYKYVLDIDGNGWSGRFKRLIVSNSLVFKASIYPEWFSDRIAPWVHYIPIQLDLSDLHDALAFFRGDASGAGAHEDLARKIAAAGQTWSKEFWRKEDMVAYYFRLFLEYARVMSEDREAMSYKGDGADL